LGLDAGRSAGRASARLARAFGGIRLSGLAHAKPLEIAGGANLEPLVEIKRRYGTANLFRLRMPLSP
jgi:hypothetical protein